MCPRVHALVSFGNAVTFTEAIHPPPIDVATPAEYGIPYSDLTLITPDKVKIRAYLLVQRRTLLSADGSLGTSEVDVGDDDADVRTSDCGNFEILIFQLCRPNRVVC
jgi:hypothetical protein